MAQKISKILALMLALAAMVSGAPEIASLDAASRSEQIVTVTVESESDTHALLNVYEKIDGIWFRTHADLPARVGSRGIEKGRKQGSYKTPAGEFGFVFAFGTAETPNLNPAWEYRKITPQSYWILDRNHSDYNRWRELESTKGVADYEHLQSFGSQYALAFVIDFNYHSPVKGDGGAIFLHIKTDDGKATAGCIALERADMESVAAALKPQKNPRIIICTEEELSNY